MVNFLSFAPGHQAATRRIREPPNGCPDSLRNHQRTGYKSCREMAQDEGDGKVTLTGLEASKWSPCFEWTRTRTSRLLVRGDCCHGSWKRYAELPSIFCHAAFVCSASKDHRPSRCCSGGWEGSRSSHSTVLGKRT